MGFGLRILGNFPNTRLRRNRQQDWIRKLVAENLLSSNDFILPIFVAEGVNRLEPVDSMPGVNRVTLDLLDGLVNEAASFGIPAFAIFEPFLEHAPSV